MKYIKKLQEIGFSEKEAMVYLAILQMGMAKISDISRKINIPRTSVYNHLERLIENDYLRKTKNQGVEYLVASDPEVILDNQRDKINSFSEILSELKRLGDLPSKRPNIEFSDVKSGMLNMNKTILEVNNEKYPVCAIESGQAMSSLVDIAGWKFMYNLQKKINKKQPSVLSIFTDDALPCLQKMPIPMQKIFCSRLPVLNFLKKEEFPFEISMFLVYPRYIFIMVPQNLFSIQIENNHIYRSFKTMFLEIFKKTHKLETKNIFE